MNINETKSMIRNHNLKIKDTSPPRSFGYEFAIFRTEQVDGPIPYTRTVGEPLLKSTTVYEPETFNKKGELGAYRAVFSRDDVEALLND